jgi:hypothetical protein
MTALEKLMGEIAQKAYEGAGGAPGSPGATPPGGGAAPGAARGAGEKKDDVIDAEFEEGS